MRDALPVISLFSGIGGLDLATERYAEGLSGRGEPRRLKVAVATDINEEALKTLQINFPDTATLVGNIRTTPTRELLQTGGLHRGEATLVIGGPPCTPFSKSGYWLAEKRTSSDPDASLLDEYVRVVREALPEAFILENVQGLTYGTHRAQFHRLLSQLTELGYNPQWRVLLAAEYGVPQLRRRVFVIGRREGMPFQFPETTHSGTSEHQRRIDPRKLPFVTARQALRGVVASAEPEEIVEGEFADLAAEIPPGQNYLWHTNRYQGQPVFKWRSRFWTFLLRLDPDRPATTLQAQPGPWVGPFHWENVINERGQVRARRLRVQEMLRLMTFPDDFQLLGDRATKQRHLGNAVPIELGKVVVRALMSQLGHFDPVSLDQQRIERVAASVS